MKILFGIKNCDTVKKAVNNLTNQRIAFEFHNFKTEGIDRKKLKSWADQVGWEKLVNKKSTTWRSIPVEIQNSIKDSDSAIAILETHTSLIKRPVLEEDGRILAIGFDETVYQSLNQK